MAHENWSSSLSKATACLKSYTNLMSRTSTEKLLYEWHFCLFPHSSPLVPGRDFSRGSWQGLPCCSSGRQGENLTCAVPPAQQQRAPSACSLCMGERLSEWTRPTNPGACTKQSNVTKSLCTSVHVWARCIFRWLYSWKYATPFLRSHLSSLPLGIFSLITACLNTGYVSSLPLGIRLQHVSIQAGGM